MQRSKPIKRDVSQPDAESFAHDCWCGATKARHTFGVEVNATWSLEVCACEGCDVKFLHPQPTDEQLMPFYDTPYYGASRSKFVGPVARFVRAWQARRAASVARYIQPPARVLDVGCGNGQFLMDLHQRGFEVEGTELSSQSAKRVPEQLSENIHVGDLLSLNLPRQHYDAITLWHVLEHVRDPHAICGEINELLKPGGWLMLSLPNAQSPEATMFGRHWFHLDPPRHLYGLGTQSLTTLLDAAGFEVMTVSTWSLEQNPFGFVQSCLNAMGFKRDRAYDTLKGVNKGRPFSNLIDLLMLALLTPAGVLWSCGLSLIGKGSTMTLAARKR